MVNKKRATLNILSAILVLSLGMILIQNIGNVDAYESVANTTSHADIDQYFALEMSANLTDGIRFGNIDDLNIDNHNASGNYNTSDLTQFYILVSEDSNTNVSFQINASDFTSGTDTLGVTNESFSNSTANTLNDPSIGDETSLTEVLQDAGNEIDVGEKVYYRFWLDTPNDQPTGTYQNEVWFKGSSV